MAAKQGGSADLDRLHDASLGSRQQCATHFAKGFSVSAKNVRYFQFATEHGPDV
jgi:hypothetical protein